MINLNLNKKFFEEFKTVFLGLQRTTQNRDYGIWHELQSFTLSSIKRKRLNSKHRKHLNEANLGKSRRRSRSICKSARNSCSISKIKKLETTENYSVKNELRKKNTNIKKIQVSKASKSSVFKIQNINEKFFYEFDFIRRRTTYHSVTNMQILKRRYTIK